MSQKPARRRQVDKSHAVEGPRERRRWEYRYQRAPGEPTGTFRLDITAKAGTLSMYVATKFALHVVWAFFVWLRREKAIEKRRARTEAA